MGDTRRCELCEQILPVAMFQVRASGSQRGVAYGACRTCDEAYRRFRQILSGYWRRPEDGEPLIWEDEHGVLRAREPYCEAVIREVRRHPARTIPLDTPQPAR